MSEDQVNTYCLLRLTNVTDAAEEWLSANAFDYGALGVSEVLDFDQPEGEEDVFTKTREHRTIDAYFADAPPPDFIETLRARFPDVATEASRERNRDWLAEWKKGFKPFALTNDHWVVPSWCEPPAAAKHRILIDPGMAFGTGTHETTRLVSQHLGDILRAGEVGGKSVGDLNLLDVGTGTGILAILARQLGVKRIVATEIEADSRRVARENFELNACADVELDEKQLEDLTETFDIIVANIIDGVLVRIREALFARLKPGGWLVVSGIIGEREPDFLAGFTLPPGTTWTVRRADGDWILYAVNA